MRGSAPCFKSLAPVCRRLKFPTIFSSLWSQNAKKMSYAKLQNLKTHQTILLCIFLIVLFEFENIKVENIQGVTIYFEQDILHSVTHSVYVATSLTGRQEDWTHPDWHSRNCRRPMFLIWVLSSLFSSSSSTLESLEARSSSEIVYTCSVNLIFSSFSSWPGTATYTLNMLVSTSDTDLRLTGGENCSLFSSNTPSSEEESGTALKVENDLWTWQKERMFKRIIQLIWGSLLFLVLFQDLQISIQPNHPLLTSILLFPPRFCVGDLLQCTLTEEQWIETSSLHHTHRATEVDRT